MPSLALSIPISEALLQCPFIRDFIRTRAVIKLSQWRRKSLSMTDTKAWIRLREARPLIEWIIKAAITECGLTIHVLPEELIGVPGAIAGKCTVRCPDRLS
jgi:hypothetical protein